MAATAPARGCIPTRDLRAVTLSPERLLWAEKTLAEWKAYRGDYWADDRRRSVEQRRRSAR